jgi:hypothetical protein
MSYPRDKNIFFFINRAKRIQALWRGYKFRKGTQYHMVCGACDNPEIIIRHCTKKEYLADVSKIWNQRCKNCRASYDERTTKFVLCVQHLGIAPCSCCAELEFQRQILEAYDFHKRKNQKRRWN